MDRSGIRKLGERPVHSLRISLLAAAVFATTMSATGSAQVVLITAPKSIGPLDTTITPTAGGTAVPLESAQIIVQGTTLTMNGRHAIASLRLERNLNNQGAVLTHASEAIAGDVHGFWLEVSGDVDVQGSTAGGLVASAVDVSGKGFGPGGGIDATYGPGYLSWSSPTTLGAGRTSRGGGCARFTVDGSCKIDGICRSNGAYAGAFGKGGSGGSIWIRANAFVGSGAIQATGGNTDVYGASGPGGSVCIEYLTDSFVGTIDALGGTSGGHGAPGTVYKKPLAARLGDLTIDNGGGGASYVRFFGSCLVLGNLKISGSSFIVPPSSDRNLHVQVAGSLVTESGSGFYGDGQGYPLNGGPGRGSVIDFWGIGSGYGGRGERFQSVYGQSYGSALFPDDMGSSGTSHGGGYLQVSVVEDAVLNGALTANGEDGGAYSSCGSGGAIVLSAGRILGNGTIRAGGGVPSYFGGMGGGGRILIRACDLALPFPIVSAPGFEAGTVLVKTYPGPVLVSRDVVSSCSNESDIRLEAFGRESDPALFYRWAVESGPEAYWPLVDGDFLEPNTGARMLVSGSSTASLRISNIRLGTQAQIRIVAIANGSCGASLSDTAIISICTADFNCDGAVNDADFVPFAAAYNILDCADPAMASGCPADLNNDGLVDDSDFVIFVEAYNRLGCS